jgi:hypothetical protein
VETLRVQSDIHDYVYELHMYIYAYLHSYIDIVTGIIIIHDERRLFNEADDIGRNVAHAHPLHIEDRHHLPLLHLEMYMYVYLCMYISICIFMYVYICIFFYIHKFICIYISIYIYVYVYIYMFTYRYVYKYIYIHTYVHIYSHA